MTNKEIFEKAYEKAYPNENPSQVLVEWYEKGITLPSYDGIVSAIMTTIIFSHDFAKKFWGESPLTETYYQLLTKEVSVQGQKDQQRIKFLYAWQYHLQLMALYENRLKYLEQFLGDE